MRRETLARFFKSHFVLWGVLAVGLINGLLFVSLVPAWQHYDEPGNFEFAWLIANRPGLPKTGDYDQTMRRELAASMVENGFFKTLNYQPDLLVSNEPVWIGYSQITSRPLYYWLAALPLRVVRFTDITFQLYAARLVSIILYLIVLSAAYGIMVDLTPPGHPLRWILPLTLALLPAFTDIMSAVNDDVGATAFFSLFIWASVHIIKRGFSFPRLAAVFIAALACYWTKNTVAYAILLAPIPVIFSLPTKLRMLAWPAVILAACVSVFLIFNWSDPAYWLTSSVPSMPTRIKSDMAPIGSHAFQIGQLANNSQTQLIQFLPDENVDQLRGQQFTLGAWIWSDEPGMVRTPILSDGKKSLSREVSVTTTPSFFAFSGKVDPQADTIQIKLDPYLGDRNSNAKVFYDGTILAAGGQDKYQGTPEYVSYTARSGNWNGVQFENLIRNPSAEQAWPGIHPKIARLISTDSPIPASMIVYSLLDWSSSRSYFQSSFLNLYTTFWGKFGWGNVRILGRQTYRLIGIVALIGMAGATGYLWVKRRYVSWNTVIFLGICLLTIWGSTFLRVIPSLLGAVYIPTARYAFPAMIPTMLILCVGWYAIFQFFHSKYHMKLKWAGIIYLMLLLAFNFLAMFSIFRFYNLS